MAFNNLARNFVLTSRLFIGSSITSLLMSINFRVFTSGVSREIIPVVTAPNASGIVRNSFPFKYWRKKCLFIVA